MKQKQLVKEIKEDSKEMKEKLHEMEVFMKKTFGDKSKLEKMDIEFKYEGILRLLKYNLFGILSNSLTLGKMRELVEDDINLM